MEKKERETRGKRKQNLLGAGKQGGRDTGTVAATPESGRTLEPNRKKDNHGLTWKSEGTWNKYEHHWKEGEEKEDQEEEGTPASTSVSREL